MGTSIVGYIEARSGADGGWRVEIELCELFRGRDRDAFECLFGVSGWAGFEPLAAGRGLPEDVSEPVRAAFDEDSRAPAFMSSWITRAEIAAMDGEEVAEQAAFGVYRAVENDGGDVRWEWYDWRPEFNYDLYETHGLEPYDLCDNDDGGSAAEPWPPGAEWMISHGVLHRVERLRRKDVIGPQTAWAPVWDAMAGLSERYGDSGVRLVVWFV